MTIEEFRAKYATVRLTEDEIRKFYDDEIASAKFAEEIGTVPCPDWCTDEPGHGYDTIDHEERTAGRYHTYRPRAGSDAWLHQYEERRGDEITYEPLGIICDVRQGDDIEMSRALELAADLVMVAKVLTEIQSAPVATK